MNRDLADLDARSPYGVVIVLSIFFSFLTVLYLAVAIRGGGYNVLVGIVISWALLASYVFTYRVQVSNGRLKKRTLFGTTEVALSEVRAASVRTGIPKGLEVLLPPVRLEIERSQPGKKLIINLKMLRKPDINNLLQILGRYTQVSGARRF